MDDKISVSVIMPAYNAGAYIAQAIESVLCQKVSLELLVIDDCSADSTAEIVTRYTQQDERVILIRNTRNQGVAESRNIGIRRARGTYLAFLDADDWWQPEIRHSTLPAAPAAPLPSLLPLFSAIGP